MHVSARSGSRSANKLIYIQPDVVVTVKIQAKRQPGSAPRDDFVLGGPEIAPQQTAGRRMERSTSPLARAKNSINSEGNPGMPPTRSTMSPGQI